MFFSSSEGTSGCFRWRSNKWREATEATIVSVSVQHCVWFPWMFGVFAEPKLEQPSCRLHDGLNLSWAASGTQIFPLIDLFTLSGSCDGPEGLSGFVCWEDQSRRRPFFYICCSGKSRKLDFSWRMESGSSKRRHLAPTQAKAGRLQLPKSSFNGWNHESRQSVFQIESMPPGSSWFFHAHLDCFYHKKREFCHIQGSILSLFKFFLLQKPDCLPHPHT